MGQPDVQTRPPGAQAQTWPAPRQAWSVVALFCVVAILSYTDRQILGLLVDPIRADLHVSDTQIGVLQGIAFAVVYSFAGLPLGRLADLVQRRGVILAGVGLWSAGTLLCGCATSFWMLFAGRLVVGIGEAALAPAATSMIADMFPTARRGTAIGLFAMGMVIGGGAAISIGGAVLGLAARGGFAGMPVIGTLAPWRTVLVLLALSGVPLLALLSLVPEPARHRTQAEGAGATAAGDGLRAILAQLGLVRRALVPLVLGCALMSVGDFAMLSWAPALLGRRYLLSPQAIGLALGTPIVIAGALASLGGGAISDRLARRRGPAGRLQLAGCSAIVALPFALVAITASANEAIACVALWTLFSTVAGIVGMTAIQEIVPNRARGLSASFISFGNIMLGLGGGATLTGFVTDHVFGDPLAVGRSLTLVILPAGIVAILLFFVASRAARSLTR
ncbi:MAG: MFS transporter [Janthinobacterium lividum]